MMVNFMFQLDWANGDAQIAGKTFYLDVSVRGSPEEISS